MVDDKELVKRLQDGGKIVRPDDHCGACPVCGECAQSYDMIEPDDNVATQMVSCCNCGAEWVDIFRIVGYAELRMPDNYEEYLDEAPDDSSG